MKKAPYPDGFSIEFLKGCWDMVKMNLIRVFVEFYLNATIGKSMKATFITLTTKKGKSGKVFDYYSISLMTSAYKIIIKVMS